MKTVRQILDGKGRDVWTIEAEDSVYNAIKEMADRGVGALVVLCEGKPVGIISERDYARKVILQGKSSKETTVSAIMTSKVIYVSAGRTVDECMALMTEKRIRHLPVMDADSLTGMLSVGDLVKATIDDQQFIIEQLVRYIRT